MYERRPIGIKLVGLFFLVRGLFLGIRYLPLIIGYGLNRNTLISLSINIIYIITGILILQLRKSGRIITILFSLVDLVRSIFASLYWISPPETSHSLPNGAIMHIQEKTNLIPLVYSLIFIFIYSLIIYYFTRSKVKKQFK